MDEQTRRLADRLSELESRLSTLWNYYHQELRTAGIARDRMYAELDAWIAEVRLLQASQRHLEGIMTNDERAKLIGNDLTRATDALVRLCWPDNERAPVIVSDFLPHVVEAIEG